jgi:hypothetical protein
MTFLPRARELSGTIARGDGIHADQFCHGMPTRGKNVARGDGRDSPTRRRSYWTALRAERCCEESA